MGETRLCRCCQSKGHKTLTCPDKKGVCSHFTKSGSCKFGDECIHLHQAKDVASGDVPPSYHQATQHATPGGPPAGWVPPVPNASLAVAKERVPWATGKVLNPVCRGEGKGTCEKEFGEKEED